MIYELTVANFFTPTQTLASNIRGLSIQSNLTLVSSYRLFRFDLSVNHHLLFNQYITPISGARNLNVTNNLFLTQSIFKGPYIDPIIQWLAFWQQAKIVPYETPVNTLSFIQSVVVVKGKKPVTNTLTLSQTITVRKSANLTVINTLTMTTRQTGYLPHPSYVQGINNYEITPQSQLLFDDGTEQFTLRRPEFNDTERYEASRIMRRTRAGTLLLFRKPYWPTSRTLNYTFSHLCEGKGQRILAFLQKNLGKTFQLTTHEGILWEVICMTPSAELIQQIRGGQSITLEFQGEPIN